MSVPIDLERLEAETFRSYQHEDGMWDVFMGLMMAFWALGLLVDSTFVSLLMLVPPAVFIAGKAIITVPRLGRVMFNRRRVGRELILVVAVVAAVVTTSIVVLVVAQGFEGLERAGDALFIAMAIIIFTIIAYMLEYWRIAVWAVLLCVSWAVAIYIDRNVGAAAFVASGAVAVVAGLMSLRTFIHKYPPIPAEE